MSGSPICQVTLPTRSIFEHTELTSWRQLPWFSDILGNSFSLILFTGVKLVPLVNYISSWLKVTLKCSQNFVDFLSIRLSNIQVCINTKNTLFPLKRAKSLLLCHPVSCSGLSQLRNFHTVLWKTTSLHKIPFQDHRRWDREITRGCHFGYNLCWSLAFVGHPGLKAQSLIYWRSAKISMAVGGSEMSLFQAILLEKNHFWHHVPTPCWTTTTTTTIRQGRPGPSIVTQCL